MPLIDLPLKADELKKIITGKGAARRIPMTIHQWIHARTFGERESMYQELLDQYPCGNIKPFIPDLIEIGLDVLHPIQKYTMDEKEIAENFGKDICILAGMDVQYTIPFGNPEDVRKEIRFLFDTYFRKEGRLMLTAGNGMTKDTPYENLKAFLDEALIYGQKICGS